MDKNINRIKAALAEKKEWGTNDCQPTMETYLKIAELLDVELTRTKRGKTKHTSLSSLQAKRQSRASG